MTVSLAPVPVFQGVGFGGLPLPGGKLFTYVAGTSTPQATYTDSTQLNQNTNPTILNANGQANVWLVIGQTYKLILQDAFGNQIWSVDNIPGGISLNLTQQTLGQILYPLTAAEIAVGATPVNFIYPADPYVDPRRYGADPLGVINSTVAVQTALNVAYQANGALWIGNQCNFLCGALKLTLTGANSTGIRIMGSSAPGSSLTAISGLSSPLITLSSSSPATLLIDSFVKIENLRLVQPNGIISGGHGISFQGIAEWQLLSVQIYGFDHNFDVVSSLVGLCDQSCEFAQGNYGVSISLVGTVNTTNLIRINNSRLVNNTIWGLEYGGGTQLHLHSNDIEVNGTSGNFATGGVHIKGNLSPDAEVGGVLLDYNWFESNLGTSILIDAQTSPPGTISTFEISGGHIIGAQSGASITCTGMTRFIIQNLGYCDICVMAGHDFTVINSVIGTLTDTSLFPTYINVQTSIGFLHAGRLSVATLSLTGCTTVPTISASFLQQGDQITCYIPDFTGTSNSTSCTITGFPAALVPSQQHFMPCIVENNSTDDTQMALFLGANTTMIFYQATSQTGFTSTGSKGIRSQEFRWRL